MYNRVRLGLFNLVRKMDFCLFARPVFAYCFILNRECYTSVQNVNLNYIGSIPSLNIFMKLEHTGALISGVELFQIFN